MWNRVREAVKNALTLDALVQTVVWAAITLIAVALLGGFTDIEPTYLAMFGGGVFLLLFAAGIAVRRAAGYEAKLAVPPPAPPRIEEETPWPEPPGDPAPEWVAIFSVWSRSGGVVLSVESDDGSTARDFGCEVRDHAGKWHRASDEALNRHLDNSKRRAQSPSLGYPADFPTAPELPLEDGDYAVKWYVVVGPGKRVLAAEPFWIRNGDLALDAP